MKKPNLFILGAPKCGTTSLASWLGAHPDVFMCSPKEPCYFSKDLATANRRYKTISDYGTLFENAHDGHIAVGEASTTYLRSGIAVKEILDYAPDARFVVMLRSPIEMAPSLHAQELWSLNENIASFADAWEAEQDRAAGRRIPFSATAPHQLYYGSNCKLGVQLKSLYQITEPERVCVIFFEDLKVDPAAVYRQVLTHVGAPTRYLPDLSTQNARRHIRGLAAHRVIGYMGKIRSRIGLPGGLGILATLQDLNSGKGKAECLSPEVRETLCLHFKDDVALLSKLTSRDLAHWLAP